MMIPDCSISIASCNPPIYNYERFTETEIFTKKIEEKETNVMKLMIASDIHGSAYYCLEMLDAMKKECPDRLLLLGDILYHGPRNDPSAGIRTQKGNQNVK